MSRDKNGITNQDLREPRQKRKHDKKGNTTKKVRQKGIKKND